MAEKHLIYSLALAALGYDVLATDLPGIISSVLLPNIQNNARLHNLPGTVQVRALDWTISPSEWNWDDGTFIAPTSNCGYVSSCNRNTNLRPPFDLIVSSDTVYNPSLTTPLLRTIHHLLHLTSGRQSSSKPSRKKSKNPFPPVLLALEARDPEQIASFFQIARNDWELGGKRVPIPRVRRAMGRSGLGDWKSEDWDGVEVWELSVIDETWAKPKESNAVQPLRASC